MTAQTKTTSLPELTAILLARLGFLWLLVFVSFLLPNDYAVFYTLMGIAFIITIPYSLWLKNKVQASQLAPLQFLVDLVLVTGLVYYTGGAHSDLALLYPLVILSAGIVGTKKQAAEITTLAILLYTLMATLLSNRVLIEFVPENAMFQMQTSGAAIIIRGITFAFFGIASVYVAKRCNYSNAREKDVADTTYTLLSNIPTPALLLNTKGKILFANNAADTILDTEESSIQNKTFSELCADKEPISKKYGNTTYLSGVNRKLFPIAYEALDFQLPRNALPDIDCEEGEKISVTLLSFIDISHALETDRQLKKVARITAATRIAGEMAHEIRTPLTSISASVQLLRMYEDKATSADWLPNSPRRKDRKELFDHIHDASIRMDEVVQNFVDFAEFSPADLLSIIKLDSTEKNEGYIDHLNTLGRDIKHGKNTDSGRRSDDPQLIK